MELCARRSRCWCWHGLAVNRVHLLAMNRAAEIVVSLIFVIDFRLCICADHASADRYFNEALTLEGYPSNIMEGLPSCVAISAYNKDDPLGRGHKAELQDLTFTLTCSMLTGHRITQ